MGTVRWRALVCLLAAVFLSWFPTARAEPVFPFPATGPSPSPQAPQAPPSPRGTTTPGTVRPQKQAIAVRVRGFEIQTGKARRAGLPLPFAMEPANPDPPAADRPKGRPAPGSGRVLTAAAISDAVRQCEVLAQHGLAKAVADVVVLTAPGQPAKLRSGGEFPIAVPLADGTVRQDVRFAGLEVEVTSKRLGDRVRLDCQITHSEKDLAHAVQVGAVLVPGLRSSRVTATSELEIGETCLLGQITPPLAGKPLLAKVAATDPATERPLDRQPPMEVANPIPAKAEEPLFDPTDILWLITVER